jgi:hypothetical protein
MEATGPVNFGNKLQDPVTDQISFLQHTSLLYKRVIDSSESELGVDFPQICYTFTYKLNVFFVCHFRN